MIKHTVCFSSMPITVQASLRVRKLALHSNRSRDDKIIRSFRDILGAICKLSGFNSLQCVFDIFVAICRIKASPRIANPDVTG